MKFTCTCRGSFLSLITLLSPLTVSSQAIVVQSAVHADVSMPLRDMKQAQKPFWAKWKRENETEVPNKFRSLPSEALPDSALQTDYHVGSKAAAIAPIINFNGITNASNTSRVTPPDPAGDVGPNHYVQVVNSMLQIFSKTGASLYGPVMTSTLWNGFSGNWDGHNNGDAIVLYDENADRWIIAQFAIDCPGTPKTEYEMVAVSTTGDPTGSYYRYAFQFDYMPDYPKFGVWHDGYYLSVNRFNTNTTTAYVGAGACVLERSKMLSGDPTAQMVYFKTEQMGGSGSGAASSCWAMLPSDCDGPFAAAGTPNYFAYIDGHNTAQLRLWALHADWTTPGNSTFTYVTSLPVTSYSGMGSGSVPELGTLSLDGLGDRLMFRNQYRNFGNYEAFVTCHSVNTGSGAAGIRWYEYRKTGAAFSLYQQSTFAPNDGKSRWMGSIAMNAGGAIGLAYSVSSSTMNPSIYFTGRRATDPLNEMTFAEGLIHTGTVSMTSYSRWGDYSALNVDPADHTTFWTTQEYVGTFGGWCPWATKIASFKFANNPAAITLPATLITGTSATINGTLNPNGLATTWYFEWGPDLNYGFSTAPLPAGSGSSIITENFNVTGLITGTTYHYRLVASNSDGVTYGNDLTFGPGVVLVTSAPVSSVVMYSAASGGTVTADGGLTVTARGVCWATTANPVASGSHTADGTGTGGFVSSITGLLPNTLYHLRAYATNSSGTYYGADIQFTTMCLIVSTYPWNEGFENGGAVPACWTQEQVAASGLSWSFMSGNGGLNPPAAHSGTYNACLKDATTADNITRLITPSLNLTGITAPALTFWHTQEVSSGRQDQLSVYYRTSATSPWTLLNTYTASTSAWTQRTISLPAPSGDYYVAFEGNAKRGFGVCIDDVHIECTISPVSISIVASSNPVCQGSGVTFNASPAYGGSNPGYQWKVNGTSVPGATNAAYAYIPSNNDAVSCVLTSSATCITGNPATSNTVTLTVSPSQMAGISVMASENPVCAGNAVFYTATAVNGGSTPVYQWKVNGSAVGTNTASYTYVPVNNQVVTCVLTSNAACVTGSPATSAPLTMTVNPLVNAGVSITASANPVCSGAEVTFTATPSNGGLTPTFRWSVNNVITGTNNPTFTCFPLNNDVVTCTMISDATCTAANPVTSNAVTMTTLTQQPASLVIEQSDNQLCAGGIMSFLATATNGGTIPVFQWKVNGTGVGFNSSYFEYTPLNNDLVACELTSNANCITGNPVMSNTLMMSIDPLLPVAVTISPSVNPVGSGDPVTFTAAPTNGGTAPSFQWKVNGYNTGTGSTFTYYPSDNDVVTCMLLSNATCAYANPAFSNAVTITVSTIPVVRDINNILVAGTVCLDAIQTIRTAGSETFFTVAPGGYATLIAGENILFYPGTTVDYGGYLSGTISPSGPWCIAPSIVSAITGAETILLHERESTINIYPNPTSGPFFLVIPGMEESEDFAVEIYGIRGEKILSTRLTGKQPHLFMLKNHPDGIYLIRILAQTSMVSARVVKHE
ncbi:MAG: choice-of-anchor J domain-containing protein [Bacteroidales bacterium]